MKQKVNKLSYLLLVVGLVMSMVVGCSSSDKGKTVDCQQLIEVGFTGVEGYATPTYVFNSDIASDRDAMDKMFPDNTRKEAEEILRELFDALEITVEEYEALKNGDKITVKVNSDEAEDILDEYGLKLSNTSFEVEVEDLEKGEVIDPFEKLVITFSGYETDGMVIIDAEEVDSILLQHGYFSTESYELKNGDSVKVVYEITEAAEADLLEDGYVLSAKEKTYTASGLEELKEINPFDYLTVTFEGYNTNGTIKVKRNTDYPDVLYYGSFAISQENALSNDDVVTITYDMTGAEETILRKGYKVTATTQEYKVEGLTDYTKVNLFTEDTIVFEGNFPVVEVELDLSSFDSGIRYNVSTEITGGTVYGDRMYFDADDVVTITVTPEIDNLHYYGFELETTEYTIDMSKKENIISFVAPTDDLSSYQAACLKAAQKRITDMYLNDYNYSWSNKLTSLTGLEVVEEGLYMLVDKEMQNYGNWNRGNYNYYYTLYEVKGTWEKDRDVSYYYAVVTCNLRYDESGAIVFDDYDVDIDDLMDNIEARDYLNLDVYMKMVAEEPDVPVETEPATEVPETEEVESSEEETEEASEEETEAE